MQARAGTLYAPGLTYVPPALGGGGAPAGAVPTMPAPSPADFELTDRRSVDYPCCAAAPSMFPSATTANPLVPVCAFVCHQRTGRKSWF